MKSVALLTMLCHLIDYVRCYARPLPQIEAIPGEQLMIFQDLAGNSRPLLNQQYPFHVGLEYFIRWYLDIKHFPICNKTQFPDHMDSWQKKELQITVLFNNNKTPRAVTIAIIHEFCLHMIYEMWKVAELFDRMTISLGRRGRAYIRPWICSLKVSQMLSVTQFTTLSHYNGDNRPVGTINGSLDILTANQSAISPRPSNDTGMVWGIPVGNGQKRIEAEVRAERRHGKKLRYKDVIYLLTSGIYFLSSENVSPQSDHITCITATECPGRLELWHLPGSQRNMAEGILKSLEQIETLKFPVSEIRIYFKEVTGIFRNDLIMYLVISGASPPVAEERDCRTIKPLEIIIEKSTALTEVTRK